MKSYTSKVLEICDNGDAIVELPDKLMEELGWKVGDNLKYEEKDVAGVVLLKKNTRHLQVLPPD